SQPADYAAAYALLKTLSAEDDKPFDEVWLVDATNGKRVRFGATDAFLDVYADAIAGALTYEPEMSGALPGIHPRGMHPTFSSFGYASLVFPRDVALQRVQARFAAELVREKLLAGAHATHVQLAAKQFVVADEFALPPSRLGIAFASWRRSSKIRRSSPRRCWWRTGNPACPDRRDRLSSTRHSSRSKRRNRRCFAKCRS